MEDFCLYVSTVCSWGLSTSQCFSFARCAAVHPGYGFLSENAEFVESMEKAGVAFLGPTSETMRLFSRKHTAREFAISAGVPVLPGTFCPQEGSKIAKIVGIVL